MDPVTLLLFAGAILQIWGAVSARAAAKTPEEQASADAKVNEAWTAAEALVAPHVAGARSRLAALAAVENPYGTTPGVPLPLPISTVPTP